MSIAGNILQVQQNIAAACERSGRSASAVTMIAVSKTKPLAMLLEAVQGGVQHLGENRVEEALLKVPALDAAPVPRPIWHMIGHIQSRKAREVPPLFDVVHSVDSLKVAAKLAEISQLTGKTLAIFLEVNISGEQSKEGLSAHEWQHDRAQRQALWAMVSAVSRLEGLELRGLMTIAPFYADAQQTRPIFQALAGLRVALRDDLQLALPDLSMGMTNDYEVAIEEGATQVRIGRAIFGER